MKTIQVIDEARDFVEALKFQQKTVAFVPTMGNLHAGHLTLIKEAFVHADCVVVSLFVNPMQFGPNEDFDNYPRTLEKDLEKLKQAGVTMVFTPSMEDIYPKGASNSTTVTVPKISTILEGEHRPGFFVGVGSVVTKLFNIIPANISVFGKKDYQQLHVISHMVQDLNFSIKIVAVETVREADGLAMSSRNGYLSSEQRMLAPQLFKALEAAREKLIKDVSVKQIEQEATGDLEQLGFKVDYFKVMNRYSLQEFTTASQSVILVAAKLGSVRLIDNLEIKQSSTLEVVQKSLSQSCNY